MCGDFLKCVRGKYGSGIVLVGCGMLGINFLKEGGLEFIFLILFFEYLFGVFVEIVVDGAY